MNQNRPRLQAAPRPRKPIRDGERARTSAGMEQLVRAALDDAPVGLIVLDPDHTVRLLTERAAKLLGVARAPALGRVGILDLLAGCTALSAGSMPLIAAGLRDAGVEPQEITLRMETADGSRIVTIDVRAAGRLGCVLSLADVTQARQTQDWLLEHASTDLVTGCCNRQRFMLMLQDCLVRRNEDAASPPPSVVLVGLHRFKDVAGMLAAGSGDTLLRMVADRLEALRGQEDMLGRLAADEFAFVLAGQGGRANAEAFCAGVQDALAKPYMVDGQAVLLGGHVGVACAPDDGATCEELVAHAGIALRDCAAAPTGLRFFDQALLARAHQRRAFETDLRHALARQEFELHYQPQVDIARGCVTGLEALVRWRHPGRGLVPPAAFIPVAEQLGLIGEIGDWVLREACRQAVRWPEEVTIAVNASPLQFETGQFARSVAEALDSTGLPARRLEVEVTENLLLHDTGAVLGTLASLQEQGVRLALDDFGTGYASLSQLSRFRFDKIKIDRSFVSPADVSVQNSAIVRSIAALGMSLGIPTTAEGVETETQLDQIKADGCTCVQGYYFSRPVPAIEVGAMIEKLHRCPTSLVDIRRMGENRSVEALV